MRTDEKEYALDCAQTFLKWTREDIKDVTKSFFKIGFRLYEARAYRYYEALGYPDIETLAEEEFGFKRSTTYGLMQVYEKTCSKLGHNSMHERYIGYDYSKLLEICKPRYGGNDFLSKIKPTDSVRDIRKYVKFWNEYSEKHSGCPSITLQEWKAQQEIVNVPALPSMTSNRKEEPQLVPMPGTEDNWGERHFTDTEEITAQPAPVQTSGLPTCAEVKKEPEKPKYNFSTRDGVRAFLKDCNNWNPYYGFIGSFFCDMFFYTLKNGVNVYACGIETLLGNGETLETKTSEILYFINDDKRKSKRISKDQFEKYCAEHKDEL